MTTLLRSATQQFHRLPGSAILLRYIQSSYQNDPVRSALELFLVIFAISYLLAPKYSTKPGKVVLSEDVSLAVSLVDRKERPNSESTQELLEPSTGRM